jgi:hypothetical protein
MRERPMVVKPGNLPDACATQVCIALSSNVESSIFARHEEPIHDHSPRRLQLWAASGYG